MNILLVDDAGRVAQSLRDRLAQSRIGDHALVVVSPAEGRRHLSGASFDLSVLTDTQTCGCARFSPELRGSGLPDDPNTAHH